ncbi:MAG TPA: serine hydrolase [Solibacterales bacterium]|nr:serine hydrolase [Bryobacterales bacterium]
MGAALAALAADAPDRIEKGLLPAFAIKGEPAVAWTMAERMSEYKTPGVTVAFVSDGKIAWARAYGDGITTETMFQAASISKPVAAMVAMKLVEQGKLALDEDVNARLKRWKVPESEFTAKEKVTLRRLLSHTAGLTVHGFRGYAEGEPVPTLVELLDGKKPANSAAVRADMEPGSKWRYSGGGYQVMQLLVEDVTGKPFAEVARELVLEPLGMKNSTYEQPLKDARRVGAARGHRSDGTMIKGQWHTYPEQAAAGLWTTPSDLARVVLEIQKPGRILKPETVAEMLRAVQGGYGLGFGLGLDSFSHGGSNEGFKCMLFAYRQKGQAMVLMTNGDRGSALGGEILRAISAEYNWMDHQQGVKTVVTVTPEALAALAGEYVEPSGGKIAVAVKGAGLAVTRQGRTVEVIPEGPSRFFSRTAEVPDLVFEGGELRGGGVRAKRVQ